MAWKRLVFRAIGGLVVLSMSWRAYAEHIWGPPSTTKVPSTTKDWQESTPATSEWRPKGSTRGPRNTVQRLPPVDLSLSVASANPGFMGKPVERMIEHHANGGVKVERQVVRDAEGRPINHGTYTARDPNGKVVKSGEFRGGKQHGRWVHRFDHDEGHLFSEKDDQQFTGPFVSEAIFDQGQLNGAWTIRTAAGQKVIEWRFDHGNRHGKSTWWYANGRKRLEATYQKGLLHGDVLEYAPDGTLAKRGTYVDGRHLAKKVEWYGPGRKHFEGYTLAPQIAVEPVLDWWAATVTATPAVKVSGAEKHGLWTAWYPSGGKQVEGHYDRDLPTGKFTWWYEDGQEQAEGTYRAGLKEATWTTWYPSGVKESQSEYRQGGLTGRWMLWDNQGKLVEVRDYSDVHKSAAQPAKDRATISQRSADHTPVR